MALAVAWSVVLGLLVATASRPWVGVAAYGAVLPFGSAVVVPGPGPTQARTASTLLGLVLLAGLTAAALRRGRPASAAVPALGLLVCFAGVAVLTTLWSREPAVSAR